MIPCMQHAPLAVKDCVGCVLISWRALTDVSAFCNPLHVLYHRLCPGTWLEGSCACQCHLTH